MSRWCRQTQFLGFGNEMKLKSRLLPFSHIHIRVWVVITCLAGRGFYRSVVFVEFLWNIFIILLWFLYQRVHNGLGYVLVCVLCIAVPGLQNYLPLFVSSCYHALGHTLCAIVGGYAAWCLARTTTGNVELCSQLSGRWGLPLHPTPWVWMYRLSWPVLHQRSALVLLGSASRSLLDLSLRELGIRDRFPCKRSSRGGRRKQKRITVICCGAARELVAKRWLEVVSCDPCPASPLPSLPPSQTPSASFFPGAALLSYMLPPPSSTTPLHRAGFLVRHCHPTYHLLLPLWRPLHRAGFLVRHCHPTYRLLHPLWRPLHCAHLQVRHCHPMDLHPLWRPLHCTGFPVWHCSPTDLHPLRRPLHRAGVPVWHCHPTDIHLLQRPLHRAGFLVWHCSPTDLHPLRRPLHRAGFLVRHCRPTDTRHLQRPLHRARLQVWHCCPTDWLLSLL